jgi:hypothetical protein
MTKKPTLTRKRNPMPEYIREILLEKKLMRAYNARPPYQRNDYIRWIAHAKLEVTRKKRLNQNVTGTAKWRSLYEYGMETTEMIISYRLALLR